VKIAVATLTRNWPTIKKYLIALLLVVITVVIIRQARTIAWGDVATALGDYRAETLVQAGFLALVAYSFYASYDLIGIRYVKANVTTAKTMSIAFVAYAINQSFGALLGTMGMRLRLYGKQGLSSVAISKMIGLAIVTNWLGYLAVAGSLFAARLIRLPDAWRIGNDALQVIGVVMLLLVASYLWLCRFSRTRTVTIRSEALSLPTARLAIAQLLVAALHWFAIAGILYVLMHGRIGFVTMLGTYLLTSISVVAARIPGGLGVIEAVFIALLGSRIPVPQLMAALLAFRGIFFIGALLLAGLVYLKLESEPRSDGLVDGEPQRNV
jgi:glycosyltransferase 2 family protein